MKIVIVGGVAAGMSAAARARRLSEDAEIIVLESGPYVSFANCGLPYHLAGEIKERDALLLHTPSSLKGRANLDVRVNTTATAINREKQTVSVRGPEGDYELSYDYLLLTPGTTAFIPPIEGINHPAASTLRTVPELDGVIARSLQALERATASGRKARAVVMGAGFIGLETAEALIHRGFQVDLVEAAPQVLPPLSDELAPLIQAELEANGVNVHVGVAATQISDGTADFPAQVKLADGTTLPTDLVIVSVGVRPRSELARDCGLELGERGTIKVDHNQRTSDPHIFAAGDATEVAFESGRLGPVLLAGPANRQGRRAADAMLGQAQGVEVTPAKPVLATAIVRVFNLVAAVTGTGKRELTQSGVDFFTVRVWPESHAGYYPGSHPITLHAYFDKNGQLLGAQAVGEEGVDKRIDVLATAIRAGMDADDLAELELCYAPPFGSAKDPVNMVGFTAQNVLSGLCPQVDPDFVPEALETGVVLDVRSSQERAAWHVPGSLNISHLELRGRLEEVRQAAAGKPIYVHCRSGVRSYLSVRILRENGFEAYNISGGEHAIRLVNNF